MKRLQLAAVEATDRLEPPFYHFTSERRGIKMGGFMGYKLYLASAVKTFNATTVVSICKSGTIWIQVMCS